MTPFLFAFGTFLSTLAGGALALKFHHRLHLLMGFAAGVLLGVVSFDILPEIISQVQAHGYAVEPIMIALVAGFLLFHVSEKALMLHQGHHEEHYAAHSHPDVGRLSALALAGHSLMDGVSIGLGFQVSRAVGILVSLAVITHDFTDGLNTVTVMLRHDNTRGQSKPFLLLDAATPLAGMALTRFIAPSPQVLVVYLGFFAGFLLYIGAGDILPEAHAKESSAWTIVMTLLGTGLMFAVARVL